MSTVIIQEDCYRRIADVFEAAPLEFRRVPVSRPEDMVEEQRESGAKVFIIGAERYPREFYESIMPDSLVIRYGVGYDHVPVELCKERGITVGYTPGTLDQSVAEHTVALMLACLRDIPRQDRTVREGQWPHPSGAEMTGKTVAILGFGRIGRRVADILKRAFDSRIVALDVFPSPHPQHASLMDRYTTDFDSAVEDADFVSLHMSVTEETRGFINSKRLGAMNGSAYLINTARGALVDEVDLYNALAQRVIAGAALDVFVDEPYEPVTPDTDLRTLPNAVLTAHVGSNTREANQRMAEICIRNAEAWYAGETDRLVLIPEMTP